MTDTALVEMTSEDHLHLVARNPAEMEQSQRSLIEWCDRKSAAETLELRDCEENLAIAKERKWRVAPWQRRVRMAKAKLTFYDKVKSALEAGYYVIPAFPVDLFAIRTDQRKPKDDESTWQGHDFSQSPRLLAQGEGDYVSNLPEVWRSSRMVVNRKGEQERETYYWPKAFQDVDFPLKLVKPAVLRETAKAMALKVFDQMGALPAGRKADPIVVGQIIPPHRKHDPLTFFVAWWLNTEDL